MMVPARSLTGSVDHASGDNADTSDTSHTADDGAAGVDVAAEAGAADDAEADQAAEPATDPVTGPSGEVEGEPEPADGPSTVDTSDVTTGAAHDAADRASSANVVELFRDKADPEAHADTGALFARLRAGSADNGAGETPDGTVADADVDVDGTAETIFDRRDAALVPLIVAAARKLKRVLADEQNDVLDALRKAVAVTELSAILPPDSEHTDRYADAIGDELLAAAVAGAGTTGDGTPAALRKSVAKSSTLAPARVALGADLVGPLRERLSRCVADGAGDNEDITKRVRAVYREWKTQHIDDQLDDVFRLAYGSGALAAATAGARLCWMVDPHGPPCPDAEDNALAGPVEAGDAYPTGHTLAPAHAGCRCLLVPVPN